LNGGRCRHVRAPGGPDVEVKILHPATVRLVALGVSLHGRDDTSQPLHLRCSALRGGRRPGKLLRRRPTSAATSRSVVTGVQRARGAFLSLRRARRGQAVLRRGQPPRDQPGVRQAYEPFSRGGESAANAPLGPGHSLRERRLLSHWALAWGASRDDVLTATSVRRQRPVQRWYPRHSCSIHPSSRYR